jgi:hypothetical protein
MGQISTPLWPNIIIMLKKESFPMLHPEFFHFFIITCTTPLSGSCTPGPMLGLVQQEHGAYLLVVETEEPTSVQEAQGHEFWRKVMLDEMTTIEANGTWELAEAPTVQHLIVLKWVFKMKKNAAGIVTNHKA